MSAPKIDLKDCSPEVRKQLLNAAGECEPRKARTFTIDRVRSESIKVLAVVANLTPSERKRVLRHALKMNEV